MSQQLNSIVTAWIAAVIVVVGFANASQAAALLTVTEGFNPGALQYLSIHDAARVSADTGYSWSGYQTGFGIALWDNAGAGRVDMSGQNASYDDYNAWTVFGGDHVTNLQSIDFTWTADTTSGNLNAEAVIQDANGDWFVSDDVVAATAGTTASINALTTTWRQLNAAPVINTSLSIGAAGVPDLSMVFGGGFHTVGLATGGQTRLDTQVFNGAAAPAVPAPAALPAGLALIGIAALRRRRA